MSKRAKPPILRPEEEELILKTVVEKAKKGEQVLRQDVINKVVEFIRSDKRRNPFRNGQPGDKWFSLFRRRHNSHFMNLSPKSLRIVEKIGFTEKVMNTVSYAKPYGSSHPKVFATHRERKRRPKVSLTPEVTQVSAEKSQVSVEKSPVSVEKSPVSVEKSPVAVEKSQVSPASEEGNLSVATDDSDANKSQESSNEAPDFQLGSKLEVMDFNEKWYPVKVVEVDYEEGEVLVHFEKWSDKYDEWVRMDSNRIRRPMLPPPTLKKTFVKNEKVLAVWAFNHKYPATVRDVLPNDKYEVLFSDGYAKILRGCKLFKATEEDLKNVQLPPPKKPAPPMGADPLDPDLGPKEERRLKKRRMDVLESYRPHKRLRLDPLQSTPESSPQPTPEKKLKGTPKVIFKMRGRPPKKLKFKDDSQDDDDWADDYEEPELPPEEPKQPEVLPEKRKKKEKKPFDESTYFYRGPKQRVGFKEDTERWNTNIPDGVSPVQIKDHEGHYRESIIIPDKKLPEGWAKHTMRRKKGAKWDVFLVNPAGRKFRSRNELRNYFSERNKTFPEDSFDFMVGRKMEMIRNQVEMRRKLDPESALFKKASRIHKGQPLRSKTDGKISKKLIKTMLPKNRQLDLVEDSMLEGSSPITPSTPPFPLTELRTPDGGFTCCGKNFRKENLFQMHMKHYHPEYSNLFGSTPNVADLAYARTVGGPLEDSRAEAMTPKNSFIERVNKYEAERKALTDTPMEVSGTKNTDQKESLLVPKAEAEEPSAAFEVKEEQLAPEEADNSVEDTAPDAVTSDEDDTSADVSTELDTDSIVKSEVPPPDPEDEKKSEDTDVKMEKSIQPAVKEEPVPVQTAPLPSSPPPTPPPPTAPPAASSIPVIKPVTKLTPGSSKSSISSEAVVVQTSSSPKTPITITKYVPPGQKPASSLTKMTISLSSEKDVKPTIKTLLPMRPPPPAPAPDPKPDVQEVQKPKEQKPKEQKPKEQKPKEQKPKEQKPKELKPKEEVEEEPVSKSRPRKRTMSESLPKKPKLLKPPTGSLEEETEAAEEVPTPTTGVNTSYRFSRNRSQVPRVSLEKLKITPDRNGRVVLATEEDKVANTPGRRKFKSCKAANKISKRREDTEPVVPTEPPSIPASQDAASENLRKEEIINCTCGYMEEDGLMIQCDLCLCWQHGLCNNIDKESDVPEKYVCCICLHPARQRESTRFRHNQDWLKEGKLPSLSFRAKNEESVIQRESMLKKSHDLVSSLLQLKTVIRSLRIKTHIATKPDHPKLYLWAKSWKDDGSENKTGNEDVKCKEVIGPQPEAAIDETECRLRLLEHVEDYQHQVDDRLTSIQAQIAALESQDPDLASDEASDHYPITKQTVQMVLTDLNTMRRVVSLD